jgi:hypothetical protein
VSASGPPCGKKLAAQRALFVESFRQAASQARRAAEAARRAHEQRKFWGYHDVRFAQPPQATPQDLGRHARQARSTSRGSRAACRGASIARRCSGTSTRAPGWAYRHAGLLHQRATALRGSASRGLRARDRRRTRAHERSAERKPVEGPATCEFLDGAVPAFGRGRVPLDPASLRHRPGRTILPIGRRT